MILKIPLVLDTSKWESIPNFADVSPRPVLVIPKATEGTSWVDPTFTNVFADLKQDGIARGTFHFHRKAYNPITQAQHFCNTIRPYVTKDDILVLDVEEGSETANQLQQFIVYTQAQFPDNLIMIYSRKNILDPIPMTQTQRDFFKQIPIWTAGYPLNPDAYSEPPSFYIPDRTKYGPTWLWQYGESIITGIQGECDVNWIAPVLLALLPVDAPIPPPADVTTTPHPGIIRTTGTRNGYRFVLDEYDPAQVNFDTVYPSQLSQVSHIATQEGAVVGSNCGEWNDKYPTQPYYLKPINFTVCDGVPKVPRTSAQPSLLIFEDSHVLIDHRPIYIYAGVKHAFTGLRYLVENGVINPLLSGVEGHSRKVFFTNASGHLFNLSTEGVYPNQGWTLPQCAQFIKALGAVNGADFGGGGDVTCWADGELLLVPENINEATGEHFERYLPNIFLVHAKNGEPPMGTIGHVKGTARSTTNIKTMSNGTLLAVMALGDVVYGEWSTQKTDLINFDHYYKQGVRTELGELCKCVVTNLTCVEETEPGGTPPPNPEPTDNPKATLTFTDTTGKVYEAVDVELKPKP